MVSKRHSNNPADEIFQVTEVYPVYYSNLINCRSLVLSSNRGEEDFLMVKTVFRDQLVFPFIKNSSYKEISLCTAFYK